MNVRCPSCETLYRVDPAKVPNEGVRASCATCGVVFLVSQRTSDEHMRRPPEADVPTDVGVADTGGTPSVPAAQPRPEPSLARPEAPEAPTAPTPVFEISGEPSQPKESKVVAGPELVAPAGQGGAAPPADLADYPEPTTAGWPADEVPHPEEPDRPVGPRFELSTTKQEPAVEPGPAGEPKEAPQPRFSRPFVAPSGPSVTGPRRAPSGPMRPSAPVFRPTPGMPMRTPPVPEAPSSAATPVTRAQPEAAPPRPGTREPARAKRQPNPFLSRDPKQKARRLARALVSDMIVYQPKKRQEALQAGTLKDAFEEEIKKSWDEYVQQIGEDLARSTNYFTEALNEILAGGRQLF